MKTLARAKAVIITAASYSDCSDCRYLSLAQEALAQSTSVCLDEAAEQSTITRDTLHSGMIVGSNEDE